MGHYLTPDTVLRDRRQKGHEIKASGRSNAVTCSSLECCTQTPAMVMHRNVPECQKWEPRSQVRCLTW